MMEASVIGSVIATEYLAKMMFGEGSPALWWDLLLRQKGEMIRPAEDSANLSPGLERGEEAEQPRGSDNN